MSLYFLRNSFRPSVKCSGKWSFGNRLLTGIWQMECDRDSNPFRRFLIGSETLKGEYSKRENHFHEFFIKHASRLAIYRSSGWMLAVVLLAARYLFETAEALRGYWSVNNHENKDRTKERRWQNTADHDVKDGKLPCEWEIRQKMEDCCTSLYWL
jgi:hypothetical protein